MSDDYALNKRIRDLEEGQEKILASLIRVLAILAKITDADLSGIDGLDA